MSLPAFLIVGTMKSGTTSLKDYLCAHKDVNVTGELHFFSNDAVYQKGMPWFESRLQEAGDKPVVGCKDPAYCLVRENAALTRIREYLPNVRLIWVFRNPVDRAYSNYWHSVRNGSEQLSFEAALAEEEVRLRHGRYPHCYRTRGLYVEQLESFLEHFPSEQMHFIVFEELVQAPESVLRKVFAFLDVSPSGYDYSRRIHANRTYAPWSIPALYWWRRIFPRHSLPMRVMFRLNRRRAPGVPRMASATREELKEFFRDRNTRLGELTGLDVDRWW